jgi:hypothetical protein
MESHGWTTTNEYFSYLAKCDARGFAYFLAHQVDTTNFDPFRDHFVTQETANQKIHSFPKQNRIHAFWAKFIDDQIHDYLSGKKSKSLASDVWDWSRSLPVDIKERDFALLKTKILELRLKVLVPTTSPVWIFRPSDDELKIIHAGLDLKMKDIIQSSSTSSSSWERMQKVICILDEWKQNQGFASDEERLKFIRDLAEILDKGERERFTCYNDVPFQKDSFYRKYFLAYQEALSGKQNLYDESSRYDSNCFWKETYKILPKTLFKRVGSETRLYTLASLSEFKKAFATFVLRKSDFYEVRDKKPTKKRKICS